MQRRPSIGIAAIVIKGKKVLLGKRKGSHGTGTWNFPGGHLEWNEELDECVRREVSEEVGLKVKNIRFATITNDIFKEEDKHYITIYMLCDYSSGVSKVMEPEKCEKLGWFEWEKLPHPLFIPIKNLLKQRYSPF